MAIRFSKLPRKGLLADVSNIGLYQLVEFRNSDFFDLTIFEMQMEHINKRAEELSAGIICQRWGNSCFMEFYEL